MTYSKINQPKGWVSHAEQQGKDVFEYSIFGDASKQTKIGDFS